MSDLAATYAQNLLSQGQLEEAKQWLTPRYAPANVWQTQVVRGDLAWQSRQWEDAALFYNQALDLLNDPKAVLTPPSLAEKQRVYQLAAETQLLTGRLIAMRDNCSATGVMQNVPGLQVVERPLPIQFKFGTTELTEDGQKTAEKLACYLAKRHPQQVTLIGHTDWVNTDAFNCDLSKRRAVALQEYLKQHSNPSYQIRTLGKGEWEPMKLQNANHYTQDQIDQINRRVEFAMDMGVSEENVCE
jgi:outer membrane protein OmpA-like peptidoglycan-associated protein